MKPLTRKQLQYFVGMLEVTREQELDCGECQNCAAEFAERQLAGLPLDEALARVEHHIQLCPECREELLALKRILSEGK
jgi:hypothetical protein